MTGEFLLLAGINTAFWLLARVVGAFVDVFSELFWEPLWDVVAAFYNIALAVFFAAVLFLAATRGAAPADFLWRRMCGFVMLYVALGAAFMNKSHRIEEVAEPGYFLGLVAYVVFAAVPRLIDRPELRLLLSLLAAFSASRLGWAVAAFMTAGIVWTAARDGLRGLFHYLAPFLWFIGALEHPPIRIRRRDD